MNSRIPSVSSGRASVSIITAHCGPTITPAVTWAYTSLWNQNTFSDTRSRCMDHLIYEIFIHMLIAQIGLNYKLNRQVCMWLSSLKGLARKFDLIRLVISDKLITNASG